MSHQFTIVLEGTSHPGNIGATARAMKNMGITSLRLVSCVDHQNSTAYQRSSGAEDILFRAQCFTDLTSALSDCQHVIATSGRVRKQAFPPTYCASKLPSYLENIPESQHIALLFGNEQSGLDNAAIQLAHCQVIVPTNPEFRSINVAACVQLVSYLCRHQDLSSIPDAPRAASASHAQISALVQTVSQYAFQRDHDKTAHDRDKLRQLLLRYELNRDEVDFLHGVVRRLISSR